VTRLVRLALSVCTAAILGCDEPEPIVFGAPVQSRASTVLEPATLLVGEVASLDVVVTTAANHRVRPFEIPAEIPGIWVLEAETLETVREPNRWIHVTRVRLRAREVGPFEWPALKVEVEVPDGDVQPLDIEAVPIEVVSVLPEFVGQLSPFGVEPLPAPRSTARGWLWATGGAAFTLACLGLIALARRQRSSAAESALPRSAGGVAAWDLALSDLNRAQAELDRDPIAGCQQASIALRMYMQRRFGADVVSRTTIEIERDTPPFAATSRWPRFVALLQRLDAFRFPAPNPNSSAASGASEIVTDIESFVRDTIPIESAR
jgi:hypothetical protein